MLFKYCRHSSSCAVHPQQGHRRSRRGSHHLVVSVEATVVSSDHSSPDSSPEPIKRPKRPVFHWNLDDTGPPLTEGSTSYLV